jgi:hypothetical protein
VELQPLLPQKPWAGGTICVKLCFTYCEHTVKILNQLFNSVNGLKSGKLLCHYSANMPRQRKLSIF